LNFGGWQGLSLASGNALNVKEGSGHDLHIHLSPGTIPCRKDLTWVAPMAMALMFMIRGISPPMHMAISGEIIAPQGYIKPFVFHRG